MKASSVSSLLVATGLLLSVSKKIDAKHLRAMQTERVLDAGSTSAPSDSSTSAPSESSTSAPSEGTAQQQGKAFQGSTTYSCAAVQDTCGSSSDRYYELIASYDQIWVDNYPVGNFGDPDAGGAYFRIRSIHGGEGFTDEDNAKDTALGPTLKVKPGQRMSILLRNNLQPGTPPTDLGGGDNSTVASVDKAAYLGTLNASNPAGAMYDMAEYGFKFFGQTPTSVDDITVPNPENIPYDFDSLNIHLHGLIVTPHLFKNQGTSDPDADWLSVGPGECYCYHFDIPESHPTGTYWWHTHRHGSTAMWTWAQAAGLIYVEGNGTSNALEDQLVAQGVVLESSSTSADNETTTTPTSATVDDMPFVVTDPHMTYSDVETNTYVVQKFLGGQNGVNVASEAQYLVNGVYQPTYEMQPGETRWLRFLVATTENLVNMKIVNRATNETVTMYDMGADGINFEQVVERDQFIQGGGMRQDLLVKFDDAGLYDVYSSDISDIQFFGQGPSDQMMATFNVTGTPVDSPVDPTSLSFTLPGANDADILASEITKTRTLYFDVGGDVTKLPFPQFSIDQRAFNLSYIYDDLVMDGHAEEWTIISTANATHPFHIHVLPFQVKSVSVGSLGPQSSMMQYYEYPNDTTWRDTVIIPPYSIVKIWIKMENPSAGKVNLNGKSVFHCHFLAHEDTGMISALRWVDPANAPEER